MHLHEPSEVIWAPFDGSGWFTYQPRTELFCECFKNKTFKQMTEKKVIKWAVAIFRHKQNLVLAKRIGGWLKILGS